MRILIACEVSGIVTKAFRENGHEAYSCDVEATSGEHPEWHFQQDVTELLQKKWDMIIAFPPCTHLAVSGAAWFEQKKKDGRQQQGINFFMMFTRVDCDKVAIENPVGIMSSIWRKPDQIIQPWEYGHSVTKSTCLWLKGLPALTPTNIVDKGTIWTAKSGKRMSQWYYDSSCLPPKEREKMRNKTFQGIADAMAQQWGIYE